MLAIVEPERTSTRCWPSARGGRCGPPSSARSPTGRPRCASSTGSTARCWPTCPAQSLEDDAPRYDRPLRRAGRPRRAAGRRAPAVAAGAGDRGADLLGHAGRHVVGVDAVRPPALPQHRRRRRAATPRAAPEAPDRPGPTPAGAWRSRPTATTGGARVDPRAGAAAGRGRGGAEPGVRRRPARRAGQLPQLRQPRAPRGDVAAVRGDRRHGRRLPGLRHPRRSAATSASTTRAGGSDIDPTPVVGRARPGRPARPPPAGRPPRRRRRAS